jgi:histidyl-tRNA synthetase
MKPSIPKGTRDFTPTQVLKRNYIFDTIKSTYKLYGYQPIETPAMENLDTLTGKYGDEGDKLIFKILNSGNFLSDFDTDEKLIDASKNINSLTRNISEKALRYDLTVPFARFVVQNQNDITFPFKRYQIQPVWRADRPQKGRYREFYQCDADVVGSNSLVNELELLQIIDEVFHQFDLPVTIKLNNRKVLLGIAKYIGHEDKLIDITVAIDKLDKMPIEKVIEELMNKGIEADAIEKLKPFMLFKGDNLEKINFLKSILHTEETAAKGIEELEFIISYFQNIALKKAVVEIDLSLARGLNYYTGSIIEVKANAGSLSVSVCGGGRYDDLTGIFGLKNVSGVGISFGADRIYDILEELQLFPKQLDTTQVLIIPMGNEQLMYALKAAVSLRLKGIATEVYADEAKMKKQMGYANDKQIPYVIIIGDEEVSSELLSFKNMNSGEQQKLSIAQIIEYFEQ